MASSEHHLTVLRSRRHPDRPLRVLSLGTAWAGNVAAMTLSELGADVIKVESPLRPDPTRSNIPRPIPLREPSGAPTNIFFAGIARSTRGIALDLNNPHDRDQFLGLLGAGDVLLSNFAPGTLDRLRLDRPTLSGVNPELISVAISGYGEGGPCASYAAYGGNISDAVGMTSAWDGFSDEKHFDYAAALYAVIGVLAAIRHRDSAGGGAVHVDVAQTEAGAELAAQIYLGEPANYSSLLAGVFQSAGVDAWLAIEIEDDVDLVALLEVVAEDDDDLATLLELTSSERCTHPHCSCGGSDRIYARTSKWAAERTAQQGMYELQRRGLAAGVVQTAQDMYMDPQHRARGFLLPIHHPTFGVVDYPAPLHRMSKTPATIRGRAPLLGEHTDEVLSEWIE